MIRETLALPIIIAGVLFLMLGEIVRGKKYAYRAKDVLDIHKTTARCTECGHVGDLHIVDNITQ